MEDVAARTQGRVAANGIELAYDTFGDPGAPGPLRQLGALECAGIPAPLGSAMTVRSLRGREVGTVRATFLLARHD